MGSQRSLPAGIRGLATPSGQVLALTAAVATVEAITPVQVVLAYLYVLPPLLLSETAGATAIWRYVALACVHARRPCSRTTLPNGGDGGWAAESRLPRLAGVLPGTGWTG
jgi:hypothetical protein